jgi:hypothetical protein
MSVRELNSLYEEALGVPAAFRLGRIRHMMCNPRWALYLVLFRRGT